MDQPLNDGEPETGTGRARRELRLEDAWEQLGRDSRAVVHNFNDDEAIRVVSSDRHHTALDDRSPGVFQEVDQHLLQLCRAGLNGREVPGDFLLETHQW